MAGGWHRERRGLTLGVLGQVSLIVCYTMCDTGGLRLLNAGCATVAVLCESQHTRFTTFTQNIDLVAR